MKGKGLTDFMQAGEAAMKDGKFTQAFENYDKAEQVAPNNPLIPGSCGTPVSLGNPTPTLAQAFAASRRAGATPMSARRAVMGSQAVEGPSGW